HLTVGATLLDVQGGFTDDIFQQKSDLEDPLLAVPQAYLSYGMTPKAAVGVGLFAPYGLKTKWPTTFDGRFAGYDNDLASLYIQPTVAYQLTPQLSVGGWFDYSGTASFQQVLTGLIVPADVTVGTLTIPAGTPIDVLLAAPIAVGGLDLFNPTTGVFRSQPVTTTIKNPAMMTLGLAYKVGNGWTLLGDYQLTWWSQFDTVALVFPTDAF